MNLSDEEKKYILDFVGEGHHRTIIKYELFERDWGDSLLETAYMIDGAVGALENIIGEQPVVMTTVKNGAVVINAYGYSFVDEDGREDCIRSKDYTFSELIIDDYVQLYRHLGGGRFGEEDIPHAILLRDELLKCIEKLNYAINNAE